MITFLFQNFKYKIYDDNLRLIKNDFFYSIVYVISNYKFRNKDSQIKKLKINYLCNNSNKTCL